MITQPRWEEELRVVRDIFPQFEPFVDGRSFGFRGRLYGKRRQTARAIYAVEIRGDRARYPSLSPEIFMSPRVGENWRVNGALCVTQPWSARSTFAQLVIYAAAYLQQKG